MDFDAMKHAGRFTILAGLILAAGFATIAMAQDQPPDMAALNAQAASLDAEDYKFVQPVCTACHTPGFFLHSRTWSDWQGVFNQMHGYGADATPEQWAHIYKYFQKTLTQININHADEDELSAVLGVDEKTAVAIVQHRVDHPFTSAEEVEAVPGVNKDVVEAIRPRLMFQQPQEDD
jgi:competence ComEA-like helix-hairpin-helix protein